MEEDNIILTYSENKIIEVPVGFTEVKYVKAKLCWLKHIADFIWEISVEFKDKYPYNEGCTGYYVKIKEGSMKVLFCSMDGDPSENMIKSLQED
jgi:hypothetical protein